MGNSATVGIGAITINYGESAATNRKERHITVYLYYLRFVTQFNILPIFCRISIDVFWRSHHQQEPAAYIGHFGMGLLFSE
jgi:hypothetical protein